MVEINERLRSRFDFLFQLCLLWCEWPRPTCDTVPKAVSYPFKDVQFEKHLCTKNSQSMSNSYRNTDLHINSGNKPTFRLESYPPGIMSITTKVESSYVYLGYLTAEWL